MCEQIGRKNNKICWIFVHIMTDMVLLLTLRNATCNVHILYVHTMQSALTTFLYTSIFGIYVRLSIFSFLLFVFFSFFFFFSVCLSVCLSTFLTHRLNRCILFLCTRNGCVLLSVDHVSVLIRKTEKWVLIIYCSIVENVIFVAHKKLVAL